MPPKTRTVKGGRRREKKNVQHGVAHIKSTFNNTIVCLLYTSDAADDCSIV